MARQARNPADRFWEKVTFEPNSGCWLWTAYVGKHGYGELSRPHRGSPWLAHVFSWQLHHGEIPIGMELDHAVCRVKSCVNPDHLVLRTAADHTRQPDGAAGIQLLKTHCPKGHPYNEENTIIHDRIAKNGNRWVSRLCRECQREYGRQPGRMFRNRNRMRLEYQARKWIESISNGN